MSKKHKTNKNMKNDSSFMGVALFPVRKIHLVQCGHALCMPVSKWLNTRRMEDRLSRIPSDQGTYILRIRKLKKLWVYLLFPSAVWSHGTIWTNMYSKKKNLLGGVRFLSVDCGYLWPTEVPLTNYPCKCIPVLGFHQRGDTWGRMVRISVLISKSLGFPLLLLLFLI